MPGRWGRKALAMVVACGAVVGADDGPPPLEPPTDLPPVAVPTPPPEEPAPAPLLDVPPENRPILVVPGLPTPRRLSTPRPTAPRPAPASPDPLPDGPPPLIAPTEPGEPAEAITPLPRPSRLPTARPNTLTLEPVPADGLDPLQPTPRRGARPDAEDSDDPPHPTPPPRRGILGRLMRPAPPRPAVEEPIHVEPRDDPAADAALKRRIESQVRRAVGDKTRSIEVRVVDRRVYIRAQVERFWQKRAVRRTLETLPAVAGYKTVVDVVE